MISAFGGQWQGLAAWQNGAFNCAPRDRWTGWKPEQLLRWLDLIAHHPRFRVFSEPGGVPNCAACFLAGMTRQRPDIWLAADGHQVLLAETVCDPERYAGTL